MKIMLRRTDTGQLTGHSFLDEAHAVTWLKKDTTNEERFTVCLVEQTTHGPNFSSGYFETPHYDIKEEITVAQFIKESLVRHDQEKGRTKDHSTTRSGTSAARTE